MDDEQLMAAYARGNSSAFHMLYRRHEVALYRFVRRLLGRDLAAHADEVFQDTWLRVVKSRERWAPQGATFRTWLFTLAHHRAIDVLRRSGRERSLDAGSDDGEREPWQPADDAQAWRDWPGAPSSSATGAPGSTEDQVFWRAAGQRLLDCLDTLPAVQRSAFLLHHEDGLAVDDLARALEVGFETAKSRLRYAMSKLRTCMGAYLPAATLTEPR